MPAQHRAAELADVRREREDYATQLRKKKSHDLVHAKRLAQSSACATTKGKYDKQEILSQCDPILINPLVPIVTECLRAVGGEGASGCPSATFANR